MSNCGDESGTPIFHVARSKQQRRRDEPGARVGDTEWGICNKYGITFNCFRKWNDLPNKFQQANVVIVVGKKYVVGFQDKPAVQPIVVTPVQPPTTTPPPTEEPRPQVQPDRFRRMPSELRASQPLIAYMHSWERPPMVNGRITGQAFRDTKGSLTIGYGHWIREEDKHKWAEYDPAQGGRKSLTMAEMEDLFRQDVDRLAEADLRRMIDVKLRQHEYDAMVDFVFHRGAGSFRQSGLESYINSVPDGRFNYDIILDNLMKYAFWFNRSTQQWDWVEGFAKRRREEYDMFKNARYTLHT
jgi:GH24 family phage-related lysozyme (muramidase)